MKRYLRSIVPRDHNVEIEFVSNDPMDDSECLAWMHYGSITDSLMGLCKDSCMYILYNESLELALRIHVIAFNQQHETDHGRPEISVQTAHCPL